MGDIEKIIQLLGDDALEKQMAAAVGSGEDHDHGAGGERLEEKRPHS